MQFTDAINTYNTASHYNPKNIYILRTVQNYKTKPSYHTRLTDKLKLICTYSY